MKKNTYFSMILKKALPETGIRSYLIRLSELKKTDTKTIADEFNTYLKTLPLDTHFEIIYSKVSLVSQKELYFKKLATILGTGSRAIQADYKTFQAVKDEAKKREDDKKLPLLMAETFELGYTPYIPNCYKEDHNIISFVSDHDNLRLCNLFAPVSKITSEINGKKKTHLKILMKYMNKNIEIIESTRDLIKNERLSNTFGDYGFVIDGARAGKISKFIADFMLDNQYKITHEIGRLQTGWTAGNFYIPQRNQPVVWLESNLEKAYIQEGTKNNQIALLKELVKGKVFINVLGAFASCLFGIVNPMNFFIHNGGLTEGGKSLAVKCALSFFGKPSKMGNNWNATLNGLESYWEQNHSLPMWIDEMEVASRIENIILAVYSFTDERGKLRAYAKDEEVKQRETKTFKGICFTTGEKSFSEVQNMVKDRVKPRGVTRRVLDLNIRDLWDNVDIEKVKPLLDFNCGHLGIDYIEYLEQNRVPIKEDFQNQVSFFRGLVDGEKANQFGLLKLALEIIYKMQLITPYEYDIQVANLKEFASSESDKLKTIKDTYTEFKDTYTEFIFANREHFDFISSWSKEDNEHTKTPYYGKVDLEKNTISVFKKEFQRWCSDHSFVKDQVLETLEDKKNLSVGKNRDRYRDKSVKISGKTLWCYQFERLFDNDVEIVYENLKPKEEPVKKVEEIVEQDLPIQKETLFDVAQNPISDKDEIPF